MHIATTTKPGDKYASIQRPRQYRALRRRGYSKQGAARISNAQAPGHRVKAPNYGAKRGETIAGNLVRGNDGQFSSGGSASAAPAAKPAKGRARKPNAPKATPAQRQQQRDAEQAKNRDKVYGQLGLAEDAADSLTRLGAGEQVDDDGGLVTMGLAEVDSAGKLRLSAAGRATLNAAERGDLGAARDAASRALDRKRAGDDRAAARTKRQEERAARIAERERKRAAAEAAKLEKKPGGGGGGGGKEKPAKPARIVGGTLTTPEQDAAIIAALRRGKSFAVYKDARGADRWLATSSTAYRDRDGEIVSCKALTAAVAAGDRLGQRGPLRFWHVPGLDIGDCDYQAVAQGGRFLIESGTFRKPAYAHALKERGASYQMSIGFVHPATQPDAAGVFDDIAIFERSVVPPGRASNPFTRITTKERSMLAPDKLAALQALLGPDDVAALLGQIQTTDKSAQDKGVAYKSDDAPAVYTAPDGTQGLIVDGRFVALKAAPPFVNDGKQVVEDEAKADPPVEEPVAEEPEGEVDAGGAYFTPEELAEIGAALAPVIAAQVVEALMPALNIEAKVGKLVDEFKTGFTGQLARKDATDAERAAQIAALQQQQAQIAASLKELTGDQPALAPVRPSSRDDNVLPTEFVEQALKGDDGSADPWGDIRTHLFANGAIPPA